MTTSSDISEKAVLDFWFGMVEPGGHFQPRPQWFIKSGHFDRELRLRFESLYQEVRDQKHLSWLQFPTGCLASVISLDQFPRNMYREDPRSFGTDTLALAWAKMALEKKFDRELQAVQRWFLYLPFEHSENLMDQNKSVEIFSELQKELPNTQVLDYAERHRAVIQRFGRFPHRNRILERTSTKEEVEFLKMPGSGF